MYRYSFLLLLLLLPAPGWAQGKNFSITAKPGWLVPYQPNDSLSTNTNEVSEGYYLALFEEQYHVEQKTIYRHLIRQIVSEAGIQNGSQINVSYNPEYEKVQFHEVLIRRDGKVINRLVPGKFKIIQKETELSLHIYSGSYDAFYLVEDVRKGDQIEYAYSVIGQNPIFGNKFSETLYLSSYEPVTNFYKALLVSPSRKLHFKRIYDAPEPVKKTLNGLDLYEWNLGNAVHIVKPEYYQPSWYTGFPYYQVSEFGSWKEVIDWAAKVNDISLTGTELQSRIAQIKKLAEDDKEKYLLEAIRFVQDDIRYMGIEMGEYSHRPNQPEKVCRQRFGDCKDKSLLLCALLRANGITAHMAYVNTSRKARIVDEQPSPDRFNHVITKVSLNDQTYWVDATVSYQRGRLKDRYNPNFGKALVLTDSSASLTDIPAKDFGKLVVNEDFVIEDFDNDSAKLHVITEYTGLYADDLRSMLANASIKELEKNYLDLYKKLYGKMEMVNPLKITDHENENKIRVEELYRINEPWKIDSSNKNKLSFTTNAHILRDKLVFLDGDRETPVTLLFPNELKYTISVKFPENWALDAKPYALESHYYNFMFKPKVNGKVITLQYNFKAVNDHVPMIGMDQYKKDMDQLENSTGYVFSYNASLAGKEGASGSSGVNWLVLFLAAAAAAFFTYLASKYYKRSIPQIYPSYSAWDIGGWLILIGIVIVVSPIRMMISMIDLETFQNSVWVGLSTAYPEKNLSLLQLFLILEVVTNVFLLVGYCLLPFLFFRKRDLFPSTMRFLMIFNFLFLLVDYVMADLIFDTHMLTENIPELVGRIISIAIWVPYLLISERVKQTFVIPYDEEA